MVLVDPVHQRYCCRKKALRPDGHMPVASTTGT